MRQDDYRFVIDQLRRTAREQGLTDIADYDSGDDVAPKSELLVLLSRLRQELYLRSRAGVQMTADRFSHALDVPVPSVLFIEADRRTADRLGIRQENAFEGSLAADVALTEMNTLIELLTSRVDED
ncbi:hypothetical protein [Curtobacterium sp. MCBD17_030]|uniref:hypothetical protein n=1 Tax=Curtobacterium sp. MCBD17_030 TaxID=2175649 RepID=UPI000D98260F|nr:hypothetical protein [Curtobacterium sp. MCBD17_030]PYY31545.1 hypothetical protein DEI89_16870 [Curtobacterium sp. MCBD17_030]